MHPFKRKQCFESFKILSGSFICALTLCHLADAVEPYSYVPAPSSIPVASHEPGTPFRAWPSVYTHRKVNGTESPSSPSPLAKSKQPKVGFDQFLQGATYDPSLAKTYVEADLKPVREMPSMPLTTAQAKPISQAATKPIRIPVSEATGNPRSNTPYDLDRFEQSLSGYIEVAEVQFKTAAARVPSRDKVSRPSVSDRVPVAGQPIGVRQPVANPYVVNDLHGVATKGLVQQAQSEPKLREMSKANLARPIATPPNTVSANPARPNAAAPITASQNVTSANVAKQNVSKPNRLPLPAVTNPTASGWRFNAIAEKHLSISLSKYEHGTPLSAREHAQKAMQHFAMATDSQSGARRGTDALSEATSAIQEAGDLLGRFGPVDPSSMRRVVDSHQTPVLKGYDLTQMSSLVAADTYFQYARQHLLFVGRSWPSSSQALTILALTEPLASRDNKEIVVASQVCLLRAAVSCNPQDATAARKLGEALSELGMYDEAKVALEQSQSIDGSPESLRALAQLYHKTNNPRLASYYESLSNSAAAAPARRAQVISVSPNQFSAMSPQLIPQQGTVVMASDTALQPNGNVQQASSQIPGAQSQRNWMSRTLDRATDPIRSIFR